MTDVLTGRLVAFLEGWKGSRKEVESFKRVPRRQKARVKMTVEQAAAIKSRRWVRREERRAVRARLCGEGEAAFAGIGGCCCEGFPAPDPRLRCRNELSTVQALQREMERRRVVGWRWWGGPGLERECASLRTLTCQINREDVASKKIIAQTGKRKTRRGRRRMVFKMVDG
jgi:hypothetical protein